MECEYDRIQHGTGGAPMSDNGDRDDANGCVYFVEAIGLDRIKIGFARSSPRVRLNQLQEGSPLKLRPIGFIPGGRMLEADIHRQFADARTHGEWFNATPELMDYIRVHASTGTYGSHTQTRNTVRVQFSLTADDLAEIRPWRRRIGLRACSPIFPPWSGSSSIPIGSPATGDETMPDPKPHTRNTKRILVNLLPADLAALDAIAAEESEPGMKPNRSAAVRR